MSESSYYTMPVSRRKRIVMFFRYGVPFSFRVFVSSLRTVWTGRF